MLNGLKFTTKVAIGQMTLSVGGEKGEGGAWSRVFGLCGMFGKIVMESILSLSLKIKTE